MQDIKNFFVFFLLWFFVAAFLCVLMYLTNSTLQNGFLGDKQIPIVMQQTEM